VWCNNCTDPQKKSLAATYPIGTTVFVGDPLHQTYKGWFIDQGWTETQPAQSYPLPTAQTATPQQENMIVAAMQFYNVAPVGWHKAIDFNYVPYSNSTNVYNIVNPGNNQNVFLNHVLMSNQIQIDLFMNTMFGIGNMFNISTPSIPLVYVTVYFWDGSYVTVVIDSSHTTQEATVKDNSGIDSHQNTVLSHAPPSGTTYTFQFNQVPGTNPNDYQNWLNQMTYIGYGIPVSPGTFWACTSSPAGLHCIHPY
jgi:hypothetical protein